MNHSPDEPSDWRERWNEPLPWPVPPEASDEDTGLKAAHHKAFRPDLSNSALVLVDVDKKSFDRNNIQAKMLCDVEQGRALAKRIYKVALPNMIRLVEFFRSRERPVIFVQWGWHRYQYPPLEAREGENVVIKKSRGAFATSNIDAVLKEQKIETCLFGGADTAWCVASTVRGAIDYGYRAVIIEDACVASSPRLHDATIEVLGHSQAHMLRTEDILELE